MNKKTRKSIWGFVGFVIIFILIMTWFFPYSFFSVNKSYAYQPYEAWSNGKTYQTLLSEFKHSFENDLKEDATSKEIPNLTIKRTQGVLSMFEQDWLISEEPVSMNRTNLGDMVFQVKNVRETLQSLIVQVEYTSDQRDYLVGIINQLLTIEDSIEKLENVNYLSRSDLKRQFNNLYGSYLFAFEEYVLFYETAN